MRRILCYTLPTGFPGYAECVKVYSLRTLLKTKTFESNLEDQ